MKSLLTPRNIAVVGASDNPGKVGNSLMLNLKNFKGDVLPVNPNRKFVLGKKCYPNVLSIPGHIDLAVIAVPSSDVKQVVSECSSKGIKFLVIISAGFSEAGNKSLEFELLSSKGDSRILGPNCFGIANPYLSLDTTFAKSSPMKGDIAFISQSGALWSAIVDYSLNENFGFSGFVSLGNMSDLGFSDVLSYFLEDRNTRVVVMYIESLKDGKKLMSLAKSSHKKIIAIKAGVSESGVKAAVSHTGSLAGSYEVYKSAFKQSGIILADSLTEAFDKAKHGVVDKKRILIVTNAGGPGALMADYCDKFGLDIVPLPKINFNLPPGWSHSNPVDLMGDASSLRFREVFAKILNKDFYDVVVVIVTPQKVSDLDGIAKEIVGFKSKVKKSVVVCWMSHDGKRLFENARIPCFFDPKRLAEYLK